MFFAKMYEERMSKRVSRQSSNHIHSITIPIFSVFAKGYLKTNTMLVDLVLDNVG